MTSLGEFVSVEQHQAVERMTENLEILFVSVSCSPCVGPGVRFGPKPQNKTASVWRSVGFRYDSLPCWGSVAPTVDITHVVLLLPDSCTTKICIFKFKIHTLCTSAYVLIHTLHTHHEHITMVYSIDYNFVSWSPLLFFPCLFPFICQSPLPHPAVFSQNGNPEAEELLYSHYVICNDTHETLRFGQVDTDENVLLASLHSHQYSWRSHKSHQVTHAHFS